LKSLYYLFTCRHSHSHHHPPSPRRHHSTSLGTFIFRSPHRLLCQLPQPGKLGSTQPLGFLDLFLQRAGVEKDACWKIATLGPHTYYYFFARFREFPCLRWLSLMSPALVMRTNCVLSKPQPGDTCLLHSLGIL
jgi:hypothetical protein